MKPTIINTSAEFSDVVREAVRKRGQSYRQLVDGTGHSHNVLWNSASASYVPKLDTVLTCCSLLGLELVIRKKRKVKQ